MQRPVRLIAGALVFAAACGGGERPEQGPETAMDTLPTTSADTLAPDPSAMDTTPGARDTAGGAPGGSSAQIALGNRIFHGEEGGAICFTCHGQDGKGTLTGPDLTDDTWLNADGTLPSIISVVRTGVPQPKEFAAPMPPMGGASLTEEQIQAVAAYVHSLSQGG